jgi:hypothetical protein
LKELPTQSVLEKKSANRKVNGYNMLVEWIGPDSRRLLYYEISIGR